MTPARAVRELQAALHLRLDALYAPLPRQIRRAILRRASRQENGVAALSVNDTAILLLELRRLFDRVDERAAPLIARGIAAAVHLGETGGTDIEAAWRAANPSGYLLSTRRGISDRRARAMRQVAKVLTDAAASGRSAEEVATHLSQYANPRYATRRDPRGTVRRGKLPRASGPALPGRAGVPSRHVMLSEIIEKHGDATVARAVRTPGGLVRWDLAPWHSDRDECDRNSKRDVGFGPGLYPPQGVPSRPHIGCMPAGVVVTGPSVRASFERWYDGQLVEIETDCGKDLAVTPNHPILTPNGWVAADLLKEGDDVIGSCWAEWMAARVDPNDYQFPSMIEKVAETLRASGSVRSVRMPTAAEDFHGDGANGEVNIVWTDRLLRRAGDAAIAQPTLEEEFVGRGVGLPEFASLGATTAGVEGVGAPALGGMRGLDLSQPTLGAQLLSAQEMNITPRPLLDPGRFEAACDDDARNAERSSDGGFGFSVEIPTNDLVDGQWVAPIPQFPEPRWTGANGRIVRITRRHFAGHVYNLHTDAGWYIANGIIVHNCVCLLIYVSEHET